MSKYDGHVSADNNDHDERMKMTCSDGETCNNNKNNNTTYRWMRMRRRKCEHRTGTSAGVVAAAGADWVY